MRCFLFLPSLLLVYLSCHFSLSQLSYTRTIVLRFYCIWSLFSFPILYIFQMVFFQRLSTLWLHHSPQHCNSSLTFLNLLRNVTWGLYFTFSFCLLIPLFESCSQYSGRRHLISLQSVLSMTYVWPFGKLDKTPQACEHGWKWILITSVEISIPAEEEGPMSYDQFLWQKVFWWENPRV